MFFIVHLDFSFLDLTVWFSLQMNMGPKISLSLLWDNCWHAVLSLLPQKMYAQEKNFLSHVQFLESWKSACVVNERVLRFTVCSTSHSKLYSWSEDLFWVNDDVKKRKKWFLSFRDCPTSWLRKKPFCQKKTLNICTPCRRQVRAALASAGTGQERRWRKNWEVWEGGLKGLVMWGELYPSPILPSFRLYGIDPSAKEEFKTGMFGNDHVKSCEMARAIEMETYSVKISHIFFSIVKRRVRVCEIQTNSHAFGQTTAICLPTWILCLAKLWLPRVHEVLRGEQLMSEEEKISPDLKSFKSSSLKQHQGSPWWVSAVVLDCLKEFCWGHLGFKPHTMEFCYSSPDLFLKSLMRPLRLFGVTLVPHLQQLTCRFRKLQRPLSHLLVQIPRGAFCMEPHILLWRILWRTLSGRDKLSEKDWQNLLVQASKKRLVCLLCLRHRWWWTRASSVSVHSARTKRLAPLFACDKVTSTNVFREENLGITDNLTFVSFVRHRSI